MPAFFVHGVPETHHIWKPIRDRISRKDVIAPDLPGFDSPVPEGFTSTKDEYADWLIAEVEKAGAPVDMVGHDWGALLTIRVASLRPDLIRTWAVGGGAIHPDYVWHDMAKMWQTPGVGEQVMQGMTGDALKAGLSGGGVPQEAVDDMASRIDDRMKSCILPLYRSAVNVGKEWEAELDNIPKTGLLIWGADDPYMQVQYAEGLAKRVGARLVSLPNTGHWWPAQRPDEAAKLLEEHWASV
jgi:pimeloyl-ACP methyl ester carboxylesterase